MLVRAAVKGPVLPAVIHRDHSKVMARPSRTRKRRLQRSADITLFIKMGIRT